MTHRFLVAPFVFCGREVTLPDDTARQLSRVLRARVGGRIVLFTGDGYECEAELTLVTPARVTARLGEARAPDTELSGELAVAIAVLKGEKLDWVVQKLTELGVSRIQFLHTTRTVALTRDERWDRRLERLQRIAREATEQCGGVCLPQVWGPLELCRFLARETQDPHHNMICCLDPTGPRRFRDILVPTCPPRLTLLCGPEGGFTPEELSQVDDVGGHRVALGRRILRAETAAIAAAAVAGALWGDG